MVDEVRPSQGYDATLRVARRGVVVGCGLASAWGLGFAAAGLTVSWRVEIGREGCRDKREWGNSSGKSSLRRFHWLEGRALTRRQTQSG